MECPLRSLIENVLRRVVMNGQFGRFLVLCLSALFLFSCSSTPAELAAKHSKLGDEYAQKEKYQEAVIEYKNAVKAGPGDAVLRFKLAKAALGARDFPTAFQELQKTIELDPNHYEARGKLGEIYVAAGKTEEAAQIADNLVTSRPQDPQGYILKAGVAVRTGKVDEAIAQLKKAVELDPKTIRPILTVGNLYLLKRDRKSAMEWYDKGAGGPERGGPRARGNLFFASGERRGEKEYRKAIEMSKEKENRGSLWRSISSSRSGWKTRRRSLTRSSRR
jgi:tetratricopeptide (TPR) repeat protein